MPRLRIFLWFLLIGWVSTASIALLKALAQPSAAPRTR